MIECTKLGNMMAVVFLKLLLLLACVGRVHGEAKQVFCPIIRSTDNNTTIQSRDSTKTFNEISGLAMSPSQLAPSKQPVLFGVNDSGGGERLGVFDSGTGERLMTLRIPVVKNTDWESMTIGSCGSTGEDKTCIYIADVGDNRARTSSGSTSSRNSRYEIIKIDEPVIANYTDNQKIPESSVSVLKFNYKSPTSPSLRADCEAVFLDHVGWGEGGSKGDLYLVTKWDQSDSKRKTRLFKFPTSVWLNTTDVYMPEAVGNYGGGSLMGTTWTGADSSFDGTLVSLVGYTSRQKRTTNYLFLRCPGSTMAEALAGPNGTTQHCLEWKSPVQGKLEAFAWNPQGTKTLNIPEGANVGIGVTNLVYDPIRTDYTCPQVAWIISALGTFCETVSGGVRKPEAWCLAAFPNSTSPDDSPLDSLQGELDLQPRPTEEVEEEDELEEKPHDTVQPPKQPVEATQGAATSATKSLVLSLYAAITSFVATLFVCII